VIQPGTSRAHQSNPTDRDRGSRVELLLLGVVGQVITLRLLVLQLARSPEDPPLVRKRVRGLADVQRRRRRHRVLVRVATAGFIVFTVMSLVGLVLTLR
jgi:hypothetical protein